MVTDTRSVSRLDNGTPGLVSACAKWQMATPGRWDAAIAERWYNWYLRWFTRTVIPDNAHLTVSLLEGLSCCAPLALLVVAGRGRRAYKLSKADGGGTVVVYNGDLLGRARSSGCADVVLRRRVVQAVRMMVLGRDDGPLCYDPC